MAGDRSGAEGPLLIPSLQPWSLSQPFLFLILKVIQGRRSVWKMGEENRNESTLIILWLWLLPAPGAFLFLA